MAKWFATEAGSAASDAVQVHGGFGYSDEYDVERHGRNATGACICEGTSQNREPIQAGYVLRLRSDPPFAVRTTAIRPCGMGTGSMTRQG